MQAPPHRRGCGCPQVGGTGPCAIPHVTPVWTRQYTAAAAASPTPGLACPSVSWGVGGTGGGGMGVALPLGAGARDAAAARSFSIFIEQRTRGCGDKARGPGPGPRRPPRRPRTTPMVPVPSHDAVVAGHPALPAGHFAAEGQRLLQAAPCHGAAIATSCGVPPAPPPLPHAGAAAPGHPCPTASTWERLLPPLRPIAGPRARHPREPAGGGGAGGALPADRAKMTAALKVSPAPSVSTMRAGGTASAWTSSPAGPSASAPCSAQAQMSVVLGAAQGRGGMSSGQGAGLGPRTLPHTIGNA